ncbi:nucleotidyltransferase family protein [Clostridium sp.]|jgi:predicted nucleotidyltransferase|uniref:nucleotidyltransferase family protein n=1 Tax=Clostridium sp. TaxID=1506 RepID=UPI003EF048FD
MCKSQSEILDRLNSEEFKNYLKTMNLNNVLVFGSLLRDDFSEQSDVDIAILAENKVKIKGILGLELYLEDIFERNIDVVDLNSDNLDIFIKINILNSSKSVYSSDQNLSLEELVENLDWYFKENENFFRYRRRDLIS